MNKDRNDWWTIFISVDTFHIYPQYKSPKTKCYYDFVVVDCFGFNVPFNTFQVHIRMIPVCNKGYDNHFIVLSHWNIIPQTQSYDIILPVTLFLQKVDRFLCWTTSYPLYIEHLISKLQLLIWNLLFDSGGNRTGTSQTWIKLSTTKLSVVLVSATTNETIYFLSGLSKLIKNHLSSTISQALVSTIGVSKS